MAMKSFAILLVSVASLTACAANSTSPDVRDDVQPVEATSDISKAANDLTSAQQKLVLNLLNDHCGDSWCEGEYDLDFQKITCSFSAKTCTFTVKITDPGTQDSTADDKIYFRACKMTKLDKFDSLVETSGNGFQDLTDGFYDKADACEGKLEGSLPNN